MIFAQSTLTTIIIPMACTYIKLTPYVVSYLKVKYNGEPIVIPESNHLYTHLCTLILPNPTLRKLSIYSYSERQWMGRLADDGGGDFLFVPGADERENYIAFKLPEIIYIGRNALKTNNTWQFTSNGIKEFRCKLRMDFWADLEAFMMDYKRNCNIMGHVYSVEMGITKFCEYYNIDIVHFETIIRNRQRINKRIKERTTVYSKK